LGKERENITFASFSFKPWENSISRFRIKKKRLLSDNVEENGRRENDKTYKRTFV